MSSRYPTCKINKNDKFIKLLSFRRSKLQYRKLIDISIPIYMISCIIRWSIVIPLPVVAPHPWCWWITLKWTFPTSIWQCHPSWDKDGSEDKSNRILELSPTMLRPFSQGERSIWCDYHFPHDFIRQSTSCRYVIGIGQSLQQRYIFIHLPNFTCCSTALYHYTVFQVRNA